MTGRIAGLFIAAALMFSLSSNVAFGCACQNKSADANGSVFVFPPAVGWAASLDDALKSGKDKNKPIAIYFATKEEIKVVGEAPELVKQIAAENGNSMPTTVFDLPKLITHLREFGIVEFVKIEITKDNKEQVAKYGGAPHALSILAPNGDRIDGGSVIGAGMSKLVVSAKTKIDAWQAGQLAQSK